MAENNEAKKGADFDEAKDDANPNEEKQDTASADNGELDSFFNDLNELNTPESLDEIDTENFDQFLDPTTDEPQTDAGSDEKAVKKINKKIVKRLIVLMSIFITIGGLGYFSYTQLFSDRDPMERIKGMFDQDSESIAFLDKRIKQENIGTLKTIDFADGLIDSEEKKIKEGKIEIIKEEQKQDKNVIYPPGISPDGSFVIQIAYCKHNPCINSFTNRLYEKNFSKESVIKRKIRINSKLSRFYIEERFDKDLADAMIKKINAKNELGLKAFKRPSDGQYRIFLGIFPVNNDLLAFFDEARLEVNTILTSAFPESEILISQVNFFKIIQRTRVAVGPFEKKEQAYEVLSNVIKSKELKNSFVLRIR